MNPWYAILNYAKNINRKIGTTLTTEKAKKIRKNLIAWGFVLLVLGFVGFIVSMVVSFGGIGGSSSSNVCPEMGESGWFDCESDSMSAEFDSAVSFMLVGFIVGVISLVIIAIGGVMIKAGLIIVVGGAGAKFLDIAPKCSNCGDPVDENEMYCNKCGAELKSRVKCSNCGTQNEIGDAHCRNCGKLL